MNHDNVTVTISSLNDTFRQSGLGGKIIITPGISALPYQTQMMIMHLVQTFDAFTPDNDPYGEHDFGSVDIDGVGRCFWKIDYYDQKLEMGSEDPTDPALTTRVLTIMRAEEY